MLDRARRSVAAGCLLLLAPNVSGCSRAMPHLTDAVIKKDVDRIYEPIVAVTLHNGSYVKFDSQRGAFVRNDSIHAVVNQLEYSAPVSDIQRVWIAEFDALTTAAAIVGAAAVSFVLVMGVWLASVS